ncbi:polynucleotide 3'-phosphatase ZDP isoform X2 [Olea europaea var. sylvestris]|uniref:polynucleotide 3'-phosphatase ZDP isoform X2 n=1 Tax=Olea europaea var. sylvestris TaxID=158386 RepID=UPI000C1D56E1|nr:polynucleotide 3'-phosphatase ZDP isoform X2 [Olea europaea var. sylvestris]
MLMSPIFSFIKIAHVHKPRNLNPNLKFLYKKTLSHISTRFHLCTVSVAMSSASVKIVAEYAKSGRSSCKKCSKSIASSSLRLGLVSKDPRGFDMTKWHHFNCFPFTDSNAISSAEAITGFSSLKTSDQEALKKLANEGAQTSMKISDGKKDTAAVSVKRGAKGLKINHTDDVESNEQKQGNFKKQKLSTPSEGGELEIAFSASDIKEKYKDTMLLPKWKAFQTIIFLERVIFTNESNIERWKNKRQAAVDSKIGRLENFIKLVEVPIQVFIACGVNSGQLEDPFRKPKPGMWRIMEKQFNSGLPIDMDRSFYVGDAAGRPNDHSDADIKFAQAIGLKFYVPEEFFMSSA